MNPRTITLQTILSREAVGDIPVEISGRFMPGIPSHIWSGAPQPDEPPEIDGFKCKVIRATDHYEVGELILCSEAEQERFEAVLIEQAEARR